MLLKIDLEVALQNRENKGKEEEGFSQGAVELAADCSAAHRQPPPPLRAASRMHST